ncbi:MAG: response regulator [Methylovulum sp.]|nr:response regulator [Methylovulum sp.]
MHEILSPIYDVHLMSGGQDVLDYVQAGHPVDLILLDVVMPGMDGFEVCKKLKAKPSAKHIPVMGSGLNLLFRSPKHVLDVFTHPSHALDSEL